MNLCNVEILNAHMNLDSIETLIVYVILECGEALYVD